MAPLKGRAQKLFSLFLLLIFLGLALTGVFGYILGFFVSETAAIILAIVFLGLASLGAVLVKWRTL